MKKLKIQSNRPQDNYQTPKKAFDILVPYLKKNWIILEPAWGKGKLYNHIKKAGFKTVGNKNLDFLSCETYSLTYDCIVTNPPYSIKDKFIARCYQLGKPFALLMPLTALEGKTRGALYAKHGIQLIVPNRRINFETPLGKGSGAWFQTAWFCWGLNLPLDLMFVELPK